MGEWHNFASIFRSNFYDRAILLVVFLITVLFDLVLAIEIGVVLAAFLFVKRMADATQISIIGESGSKEHLHSDIPKDVMIYEINGTLFFGTAQLFHEVLRRTNQKPKTLILDLRNVLFIDATGLYQLSDVVKQFSKEGTKIFITGYSAVVCSELKKSTITDIATLHPSLNYCLKKAIRQE